MARQTDGRTERRVIGRRLHVGRQNLSRPRRSPTRQSSESECDAIPGSQRLRVEHSGHLTQTVVVADLGEIVQRGTDRCDEVHASRSLDEHLVRRSFRRVEDAMGVDQPLARPDGHGSRSGRAEEEELVGRVEHERASFHVGELDRMLPQICEARLPKRPHDRGGSAVMDDEHPPGLVPEHCRRKNPGRRSASRSNRRLSPSALRPRVRRPARVAGTGRRPRRGYQRSRAETPPTSNGSTPARCRSSGRRIASRSSNSWLRYQMLRYVPTKRGNWGSSGATSRRRSYRSGSRPRLPVSSVVRSRGWSACQRLDAASTGPSATSKRLRCVGVGQKEPRGRL